MCLLQVVIGSLPIRDIQYSENVRNALVVLGYDVTRTQLESMQPDMQSMLSSLSGTCLNGVMVTCRGECNCVLQYAQLKFVMCHFEHVLF